MNTKIIYAAAGGIAAVAVAMFFVMGNIFPGGQQPNASRETTIVAPPIGVKDITVTKLDDKNANVQITFTLDNPNQTTLLLETIHYNIFVDESRMTIGDVGQGAQGFVSSQSDLFPIVAGTTLTVKDTETAVRNNQIGPAWDKMVSGNARYIIDGTYSYRLTAANLQTTADEKEFQLTFP